MKFLKMLMKNVKNISKATLVIASALFSVLSLILSFVTWEDMGITKIFMKVIIFLAIIVVASVSGIFWISIFKTKRILWTSRDGKVNICYNDIMKLSFPQKNNEKKVIVIPVNTCFDTIVDEDLHLHNNPLVSPTTVHGLWIKNMMKNDFDVESIDFAIEKSISDLGIVPIKELPRKEKLRGKLKCYENGTIVVVPGKHNIEFFLLALSEFDENNRAHSSKDNIIKCVERLLEFYDVNGQGYPMYVPLMGTGRSRAGLTHYNSLQIMKSVFSLHNEKVHGVINIVIYQNDKDKVSIFD